MILTYTIKIFLESFFLDKGSNLNSISMKFGSSGVAHLVDRLLLGHVHYPSCGIHQVGVI